MSDDKNDLESGSQPLISATPESLEFRWAFIRKVYTIISIQFLLSAAVAAVVASNRSIVTFFATTHVGLFTYILLLIIFTLVVGLLYCFSHSHPVNYILLGVFTVFYASLTGLLCAFVEGKVVLETIALTGAVVIGLTLYTFWAEKKGHDFNFLAIFLFCTIILFILFGILQIIFPFDRIIYVIYGCLASILFCGYIVFDTLELIKRYTYDDYIWASVVLYVDIIGLFVRLLSILASLGSSKR